MRRCWIGFLVSFVLGNNLLNLLILNYITSNEPTQLAVILFHYLVKCALKGSELLYLFKFK
jgi:hypothetical protein